MSYPGLNQKAGTNQPKDKTDKPKGSPSGQRRDGGNRDRDLEHRDGARKNFVLVKIGLRRFLRLLRLGFDLLLFLLVTRGLFLVFVADLSRQRHLRIEDGS